MTSTNKLLILSVTNPNGTYSLLDADLYSPLYQNTIMYDPNKTFIKTYPTASVVYLDTPVYDVNIDTQRSLYQQAYKLYKTLWIYDYPVIFKYIKKDKYDDYTIISSLKEGKKAKVNTPDIDAKIHWVVDEFFTLSDIANAMVKYRTHTRVPMWNILDTEHEDHFKEFVYHLIKRKILRRIKMQKKYIK